MTILTSMCTSFKVESWKAVHDFSSDTFKLALYTNAAALDESTTGYSNQNEVAAVGYPAGGITLTTIPPIANGTSALVDFENAVFSSTEITADGALIYNASKGNRAVCTLSFGSAQHSTPTGFVVVFPAITQTTAILRFA